MASAVDSRLAYARLSAVATASRLPTATRGSNNSYTTSWDTTWKRRLFLQDVALLPTPDLEKTVSSAPGRQILELEATFRTRAPNDTDWASLDEAVFDLYALDGADRIVVRDALFRASWQWKPGRDASVQPADIEHHVSGYAGAFLATIDVWLSAQNRRRMCAEVFNLPQRDPLRVVRFVIEEKPGPSRVEVLRPDGELGELLARIGERLNVRLANSLIGERELRVHGRNEVVIIKPAARRHWMGVSALEDADAVIAESVAGATA